MNPSVYEVYENFIWKNQKPDLAKTLYGTPPITLDGVVDEVPNLVGLYKDMLWHIPERMDILKKTLVESNRKLGSLTPKVRESIGALESGAVESAHQTVVMGGAAYVLNKAVTAVQISALAAEKGTQLAPFFCVADYDTVQAELVNIRTPLMGHAGNLISMPVPQGYENSPVSVVPLPSSNWLSQVEEDTRNNYRPMFKSLERHPRILVEERLEQALTITRRAFHNSQTLGEWSKRIMAHLFNIVGDLGIPLLTASDQGIRELLVEGMEFLLARENRERFLKAFEETTNLIEEQGYSPGIGQRGPDYVPFFYECPGKECNRSRIELHYEDLGSTAVLTGKCPSCSETVEIETPADDPYLGEVAGYLSPRVDSRQILIDTIVPTIAHVGGPGETAYYAQVIPSARAMEVPFPLFIKYPRAYFNTPWNEELAKSLEKEGCEVLHRKEMFGTMGSIAKFRRKNQFDEMNDALTKLKELILSTHSSINKCLEEISVEIDKASRQDMEKLQLKKLDVERYLSWVFGQYAENKLGQESSWSWIEWAINSGFSDLFGPYIRAYVGPMKNGATVFVNFSL
ncbi:MAG: bacillithiol biosynthesis BshC [Candidatus Thorarchaeota archaeon]|nr:bacillithiol biosynthesis BshC [Candidatus Thorarchaeota archaeon]